MGDSASPPTILMYCKKILWRRTSIPAVPFINIAKMNTQLAIAPVNCCELSYKLMAQMTKTLYRTDKSGSVPRDCCDNQSQ